MPTYANPYEALYVAVRDALRGGSGELDSDPFVNDEQVTIWSPPGDGLGFGVVSEITRRLHGDVPRAIIAPAATLLAPNSVGDSASAIDAALTIWYGVPAPTQDIDSEVGLFGNAQYWGLFMVKHFIEDQLIYPALSVAGWDGAMTVREDRPGWRSSSME